MALLRAIAVICLVALAQFHVREIVTASIQYDDAHNANVAKNLAFGFGYSTSYHEIVPFNPEATTGPAILIPAAAFVRWAGNQYWVPTFTIVVCLWAALAFMLFLLRPFLRPSAWWIAVALIAFGLAVYDADEFGLLGDVPAALAAVAAVLVLCRDRSRRTMVFAGLLLGLAIQMKLLVVFIVPPAVVYVSVTQPSNRVRSMVEFGCGLVAPSLLWAIYQLVTMRSIEGWLVLNSRQLGFIGTWSGAGIVTSTSLVDAFSRQLTLHMTSMLDDFHGPATLVLFPAALVAGGVVLLRRKAPDDARLRAAAVLLSVAAAMHIAWWFAFDTHGWSRHLLPAVVYLLVVTSIVAAENVVRSPNAGAVALCLMIASLVPQFSNLRHVFRRFEREPRLAALLATRDELIRLQRDPNLVFVGYGWWVPRDLEYVLPTVGNFKDVLRLQPEDVNGKSVVLVRNEFFNWERSADIYKFQKACDRQTLFSREPFMISACPSLPRDIR